MDFFFESRRDCSDSTIEKQYKKLNENVLTEDTKGAVVSSVAYMKTQEDLAEGPKGTVVSTVNLEPRRKYYREYYEKNKEKIREISRKHYEKNRERIIARVKNNPKYKGATALVDTVGPSNP